MRAAREASNPARVGAGDAFDPLGDPAVLILSVHGEVAFGSGMRGSDEGTAAECARSRSESIRSAGSQ
eukprot:9805157-Alexandrium_andersonii.AAC.1